MVDNLAAGKIHTKINFKKQFPKAAALGGGAQHRHSPLLPSGERGRGALLRKTHNDRQ